MEQLSQVKLNKSPYVKNLFYADSKKANSYYMVVAETNTAIQKGTSFIYQRLLEGNRNFTQQCQNGKRGSS